MKNIPIVTMAILLLGTSIAKGAEPRYSHYSIEALEQEIKKIDRGVAEFNKDLTELYERSMQKPLDFNDRLTKSRLESKMKAYGQEREKIARILDKRIRHEEKTRKPIIAKPFTRM